MRQAGGSVETCGRCGDCKSPRSNKKTARRPGGNGWEINLPPQCVEAGLSRLVGNLKKYYAENRLKTVSGTGLSAAVDYDSDGQRGCFAKTLAER